MKFSIQKSCSLRPSGCSLIAYNDQGLRLGHAHLEISSKTPDQAILADLYVESRKVPVRWLPWIKRTVCYRNLGVGTELLQQVKSLCKASGISSLVGEISGDTERLKAWYQNQGFIVTGETLRMEDFDPPPLILLADTVMKAR